MTFIAAISRGRQEPLPHGAEKVLAEHSAGHAAVSRLNGRTFSAAFIAGGEARSYPDGITVLVVGRPGFVSPDLRGKPLIDSIHQLYRAAGEGLAGYFSGGFGLVIIDESKRQVFVVRDPLGFYPLFYRADADRLWISNSIKPILASGAGTHTPDDQAIYRYLFLKAFESPDTPVREIRSLEAGCLLRWKNGTTDIRRYWDVPIAAGPKADRSEDQCREELTDLIGTVLREQLTSDSLPTGLLLSGGIDSSILASIAARRSDIPRKPLAFNITFTGRWEPLDESPYAEMVARAASLPLHKVEFTLENMMRVMPELLWNNNLPTANSGFKLSLLANEGQRHDIGTYMLGEGADTLLDYSWKWKYFNRLYKGAFLARVLPESGRTAVLHTAEEALYALETKVIGRNTPFSILRSYMACLLGYWRWKGSAIRAGELDRLFEGKHRRGVGSGLVTEIFTRYYQQIDTEELAEKLIYSSLKSYTPNQQLMNYQTICNYHEARMVCPYLDERVITYCLKLPPQLRAGKKVLKAVAERFVPQEVITREKRVFLMPMESWLKDTLKPLVDVVFSRENVERRGIFNAVEMAGLKDRFYRGEFKSWSDIWAFVVLEAWLRINYDPAVPRRADNVLEIFPEAEALGFSRVVGKP
jgi:asparagine synthase (glutamine-hydrolysing)